MNRLKLIACVAKDGGIGKDGELLFHSKKDMSYFKRMTIGRTVVMGRKTYESLGKPLIHRNNIVISKIPIEDNMLESTWGYDSIERFLSRLLEEQEGFDYKVVLMKESDIYVIGGGSIYEQLLPFCDTLYLTEVDAIKEADTYFPEFNRDDFKQKVLDEWEEDGVKYKLTEYTRIKDDNSK